MSENTCYTTDLDGNFIAPCNRTDLERIGEIGDGDESRLFYFSRKTGNQIGIELI